MRRARGFRLGRRVVKVFKRFNIRRKPSSRATYKQLKQSSRTSRVMSKLCNWGRSLKHGAKSLCFAKKRKGYIRFGQEPVGPKPTSVPKGHLAVYVGDHEDDTCRVLVPVIYFNHPLFAELLREAEKMYGYNHEGAIQIPCQRSQFESVKMRIAAACGGGWYNGGWGKINS